MSNQTDLSACPSGALIELLPEDIRDSFRGFTLKDLVLQREVILQLIEERGGEVSDELDTLFSLATDLMGGKIDRIAYFVKEVYPAHRAALQRQIKALDAWEAGIQEFLRHVLSGVEGSRLDGLAWRIQLQNNGGVPRVVVEDEESVPLDCKRMVFEITVKLDPTDNDLMDTWTSWIEAQRTLVPSLDAEHHLEINNAKVRELIGAGQNIPGVHLEVGRHVRFYPGGAKPQVPAVSPEKAPKKKAKKETA